MGVGQSMIAVAASAVLLAGCSGDKPKAESDDSMHAGHMVYVGDIDASPADMWLQMEDDSVTGAVCKDARPLMRFDPAAIKAGKASLAYGGSVVGTVSFTKDVAVGTVELSGKKYKFRAAHTDAMGDLCGRP